MGRGRQKAKATRQARDIKYYSPQTDYSALERELANTNNGAPPRHHDAADSSEESDEYADKYADDYGDDGEQDSRRLG